MHESVGQIWHLKNFYCPKSLGTMRCKKYLEKIFLSCLVSEIQLFVYIFGRNSKWSPEVRKGSPVKFFEVSYYQKFFQLFIVHKSEDRGSMKLPYDFFVYICDYKSTNSWLGKKPLVWNDQLIKTNVQTGLTFLYLERVRSQVHKRVL